MKETKAQRQMKQRLIAEQRTSDLQHMLDRIRSNEVSIHPTVKAATEDFVESTIAETMREMKNSHHGRRLSLRSYLKNLVSLIIAQPEGFRHG